MHGWRPETELPNPHPHSSIVRQRAVAVQLQIRSYIILAWKREAITESRHSFLFPFPNFGAKKIFPELKSSNVYFWHKADTRLFKTEGFWSTENTTANISK